MKMAAGFFIRNRVSGGSNVVTQTIMRGCSILVGL